MNIKFSTSVRNKQIMYRICMLMSSITIILFENMLARCINNFEGWLVGLVLFLLTIVTAFHWASDDLEERIKKEAMFEVQSDWVSAALTSAQYVDSGEALYQYTDDIYEMVPWYASGQIKMQMEVVMIVALAAYMATVDVVMAMIAFLLFGSGMLISKTVSHVFGEIRNEKQKKNARLNQTLIEIIKNLSTIIQLQKKKYFDSYFQKKMDEEYDGRFLKKMINIQAGYISQMVFVQEIIPVILLFSGLILAVHGKTTIGGVIVIVDLATRLSQNIQNISELLPEKEMAVKIRKRVEPVLPVSNEHKMVDPLKYMKIDINEFGYRNSENPVLKNIHFMILPGQIWRITGASGTGKSTLFSLLVRRNEEKEYEGEITYNEEDIRFIDRQEYYRKVLCVEQEPALFQGTIMDNITFGKNYPAQKIEEIIKICGLEDLIEKKGRDAPIENNGKNLSGGQKQRIALARMLIKEPDVLLIDEGLSGIHKDLRNNIVDRLVLYARQNNMAILTISHDHEFDHAADRVLKIGGENEKSGS